jgi:hypothetical protein
MTETHNQIIYKHENMLKDMLTLQTYSMKNELFLKDIDAKVNSSLYGFNETLSKQLKTKVDLDEFNKRIREKAGVNELGALQLELSRQKE